MEDKQKKQEELVTELESIKDLLDSDFIDDDSFTDPRAHRAKSDQELLAENIDASIEIPVLNEMVIEDEPLIKHPLETDADKHGSEPTEQENTQAEQTLSNVLPGQRSLFDKDKEKEENHEVEEENQQKPHTNTNENPFLPKHIRDRLTKPSDLEAILAGDTSKIEKPVVLPPIVKTTVEPEKHFFSANSFLDNKEQTLEDAFNKIPDNETSPTKATDTIGTAAKPKDDIDRLIDNLIAQYLPEIEAKLRLQLKKSLSKKPAEKTTPQ